VKAEVVETKKEAKKEIMNTAKSFFNIGGDSTDSSDSSDDKSDSDSDSASDS
jgi:hypothetical protein